MKRMTLWMVVVALVAWTGAASAETVNTVEATFTDIVNRKAVHVQNGNELYVWAGQSLFKNLGISPNLPSNPAYYLGDWFGGYCIDLHQSITFGYTTTWDLKTLEEAPVGSVPGPGMGTDRAQLLKRLWANYYTDLHNAEFQVAVWEILAETSSVYNVTNMNGSFYATRTNEVDIDLINDWLDVITATNYSGQETSIMWALTSTATQDFAVLIETGGVGPGPDVPEPVTMFGLLAGIGCLTHYARKRGGRASVR